jgi:hypothetical protein
VIRKGYQKLHPVLLLFFNVKHAPSYDPNSYENNLIYEWNQGTKVLGSVTCRLVKNYRKAVLDVIVRNKQLLGFVAILLDERR